MRSTSTNALSPCRARRAGKAAPSRRVRLVEEWTSPRLASLAALMRSPGAASEWQAPSQKPRAARRVRGAARHTREAPPGQNASCGRWRVREDRPTSRAAPCDTPCASQRARSRAPPQVSDARNQRDAERAEPAENNEEIANLRSSVRKVRRSVKRRSTVSHERSPFRPVSTPALRVRPL